MIDDCFRRCTMREPTLGSRFRHFRMPCTDVRRRFLSITLELRLQLSNRSLPRIGVVSESTDKKSQYWDLIRLDMIPRCLIIVLVALLALSSLIGAQHTMVSFDQIILTPLPFWLI